MNLDDAKTALELGKMIAEAAFGVARGIKDVQKRREAMRIARDLQSDQKVLLDMEIQDMLDDKYK